MTDSSIFTHLNSIEERYAKENKLIQAVMRGQIHQVEKIINNMDTQHFDLRVVNPVRNAKNYAIIMNTLLRKAVENSFVPPERIHQISEQFAKEIEQATSEQAILSILKNMARKYTLLAKNHSLKGYSPLVRKVLVHIDSDLSADLSLKVHAKLLHVNPSYLSTIFKKEIGCTLTEYVTRKRMEHAIHLLSSSDLQIQTIAQHCGIHDICYFTRTFKKFTGQTPTEYRKTILH